MSLLRILFVEQLSVQQNMTQTRHEWYCLEIFFKQDELEWSGTDTPFNEIFPGKSGKISLSQVSFKI